MPTRFEASLRDRWRGLVARHAEATPREHRRRNQRHYVEFGSVTLRFLEKGQPVEKTGKLLNVSRGGLMLKQYQEIDIGTKLQIDVLAGDDALTVAGRVAHCTETLGGFKVGVKLEFEEK